MSRKFFEETQKFNSPLHLFLVGVISLTVLISFGQSFYQQMIQGVPYGDRSMSDNEMLITGMVILTVFVVFGFLFFRSALFVQITDRGVVFRFWPFIRKSRTILKSDIAQYEVRRYKPIREFGGWGIRQGFFVKGTAYNVRGNKGLQLVLKNGKKILIGTQHPEAIGYAMKKMMELKHE